MATINNEDQFQEMTTKKSLKNSLLDSCKIIIDKNIENIRVYEYHEDNTDGIPLYDYKVNYAPLVEFELNQSFKSDNVINQYLDNEVKIVKIEDKYVDNKLEPTIEFLIDTLSYIPSMVEDTSNNVKSSIGIINNTPKNISNQDTSNDAGTVTIVRAPRKF